mmetsp:Transcript_57530/g.136885  ORF Transcript_57530/g.136885 Transcript_57530/m.136885 type:complete len:317 (-) Transcript_57530:214-1164(-)
MWATMPRTCTRVFGAVLLLCTALEHCTAFLVPPAPASSFAASAKSVHRCAARPTPEVRVGGLCRARGTRGRAGVAWAMQAQLQTYLTQTDDYSDISQAASFFVESFWERGTTLGEVSLDAGQRATILRAQQDDMEGRYGRLTGKRKLSSTLIIARDDAGAIAGIAGIEIAVVNRNSLEVLPRAAGEAALSSAIASLPARERQVMRAQELPAVAAAVLPPAFGIIPVLANLAVRSDARGAGLGQLLVLSCEACAREWGLSEVMLLVEAGNAPALRLYTSLGYQEVWTREVESARPPSPGAAEMAAASVLTSALVKAI